MSAPIYLFLFIIGITIGSFLNVCIYRIPLGKDIVRGRSYCPHCNHLIRWYHNIPVISYLILGGKCADCHRPIAPIYPAVEAVTGLLFVLTVHRFGLAWVSIIMLLFVCTLVVITMIDRATQSIPDRTVVFILILAVAHLLLVILSDRMPALRSILLGNSTLPHGVLPYIIGFFAASAILLGLGLVYAGGIGGGDIKLMAAAGLLIGWQRILLALFAGNLIAFAVILPQLLRKQARRDTQIAFGPYLCGGILLALLYGQEMIDWYLALLF